MMRKAEPGASVRVTKLPEDRLSEGAGVLARSYHDHPNFIDFFPEGKVRGVALPHVCTAGLRDALGFGHVYAAMREAKIVGVARHSIPAAAILLPVAFFLSVASPEATEPNAMIYLAYIGAISLGVGLLVLGVGLIRGGRTSHDTKERGSL